MKRIMALALSLTLCAFAAQAQQSTATPPAKTKKKRMAPKPDPVAAQLAELKQAMDAQQQQIKQLSDQVQSRDSQIQQLQQRLDQNQTAATDAASKADSAASQVTQQGETVTALKSDVSDLKLNSTNAAVALQETQTNIKKAIESPSSIHYKGITITPGGFVAAETVNRTRAASADINTPFTGIPYDANDLSKLGETSLTARQSRLSLLGESTVGTTKLTGYWEADWLGTGVTSNNRQSNSYVMRQRVIFGRAAFSNGVSFSAGQMWSLATEDRKGIEPRTELPPLTIDPQYNVGFSWARQYGARVVKDFGGKFAVGVGIEGPQATIGGRGFSSVAAATVGSASVVTTGNTVLDSQGAGGGLLNFADTTGYSINKAPDFIAKVAVDPGWGHYEVFGIASLFRNRIYPCGVVGTNSKDTAPPAKATNVFCPVDNSTSPSSLGAYNDTRTGGGVGADFRLPIVPKKLELLAQGMAGDGIGRYGSAQIADLTFRPNGTEALIRTAHGMSGLELHTAKMDWYGYYGAEYGARTAYQGYDTITVTKTPAIPATSTTVAIPATTTTAFKLNQIGGYGSLYANNSGCEKELPPSNTLGQFPPASSPFTPSAGASCAGDTRVISEATLGFWYKFYQGPKGGFRFGLQYSYFSKEGWSGNNSSAGTSTAAGFAPKAVDNMIWTSIRYYLP